MERPGLIASLSGRKLTTYDPHHEGANVIAGVPAGTFAKGSDWSSLTPDQDSALDRNYYGMLIEKVIDQFDLNPGSQTYQKNLGKANRQLIVLWSLDDAGEHTAARTTYWMVKELVSNSLIAKRLLGRFSFLVIPMVSQQGARDGFSRFPYDCPIDSNYNGGSAIGDELRAQAIANWMSDHPYPSTALWGDISFHNDNLNQFAITKVGESTYNGTHYYDPSVPVAPYCFAMLEAGSTSRDQDLAKFLGDANSGYSQVAYPEFLKPTQIAPAADAITNEMPWRHAGNKASFFYGEDGLQQLARGYLNGLATLAGANVPLDDAYPKVVGEAFVAIGKRLVVLASPQGVAKVTSTGIKKNTLVPVSLSAAVVPTITGAGGHRGTSTLAATSTRTVAAMKQATGTASLSATLSSSTNYSTSQQTIASGTASLSATAGMSATGYGSTTWKDAVGTVAMAGALHSALTYTRSLDYVAGASLSATATLSATGKKSVASGAVVLSAAAETDAHGFLSLPGEAHLLATPGASATGKKAAFSGDLNMNLTLGMSVETLGVQQSVGSGSLGPLTSATEVTGRKDAKAAVSMSAVTSTSVGPAIADVTDGTASMSGVLGMAVTGRHDARRAAGCHSYANMNALGINPVTQLAGPTSLLVLDVEIMTPTLRAEEGSELVFVVEDIDDTLVVEI